MVGKKACQDSFEQDESTAENSADDSAKSESSPDTRYQDFGADVLRLLVLSRVAWRNKENSSLDKSKVKQIRQAFYFCATFTWSLLHFGYLHFIHTP